MAIPLRTLATVSLVKGGQPRMHSSLDSPGWRAYPLGVLGALNVRIPLSIEIESELPSGAGLSSSAALLCSVATATDTLLDLGLSTEELTEATIRAETEFVGAPTGGLDQTAVMQAQEGHVLGIDFANGQRSQHRLDLQALGMSLMVINTGVSHNHLEGGFGNRRDEAHEAARVLGIEHLIHGDPNDPRLTPSLKKRVRHVVTEQARVDDFTTAMSEGETTSMGALMDASHESLRDDYEVSCPELDLAVAAAHAAGAIGARMTGGGFGGSAIALIETSSQANLVAEVQRRFAAKGSACPEVFVVRPSRGAQVVALS